MHVHLGGFESTHIFGSGEDILGTTRHIQRWREDLTLLADAGIADLRYSAPWHRIEARPGEFDWSWFDQPMAWMKERGIRPILDPLHHTSFPVWLEDGFLNPAFPELYARFVEQVAQRYPWVSRWTIVNEPLATTLFCSYTGMWYPHRASDRDFVAMSLQVARAMCLCHVRLKELNPSAEIIHVGTGEHHQALDRASQDWVAHANARRFLLLDLISGTVDETHPLFRYLVNNGADERHLDWFRRHPVFSDVIGLDYYIH
jgi:beta-glucosidase/6-phospho-beta-glucosidase/beta-galactosidase